MGEKLNWQRFHAQFTLSQSTDACLYLDNSSSDHYITTSFWVFSDYHWWTKL